MVKLNYVMLFGITLLIGLLLLRIVSATSSIIFDFNTQADENFTMVSNTLIKTKSVLFQIKTDESVECRHSKIKGAEFTNMEFFDLNLETLHKETITNLVEGMHRRYVVCQNKSGFVSKELEAIFNVNLPVSAQVIISEGSIVKAGEVNVQVLTSKLLSETPTFSYSFDGVVYNNIPLFGSGNIWEGYFYIPVNTREKVGSFKFEGKDLEGIIGDEITSGGTFLIDTQKPEAILDIKAESFEGMIKLSWHLDGEYSNFKIFRSTSEGVGYSDYYKSTDEEAFTDTSIERGKTYYYRIAAVDEASNEGALSIEVFATALLSNVTVSEAGLEPRYHGLVDNLLIEVESVAELSEQIKEFRESSENKESKLFLDLKLNREIDSSLTELNSLKREIENFKHQSLTRTDLDKKLDSSRLKLNTIRRKIPENLIVISEKTTQNIVEENDQLALLLELYPDLEEKKSKASLTKSLSFISNGKFKVSSKASNLEVVYLDGSKKDFSLVKKEITLEDSNENISIIEKIPKELAETTAEIDLKNTNYDVLKDDPIISFKYDSKEIIYSLDRHIDLSLLEQTKTLLLYKVDDTETKKSSSITGHVSFVSISGKSLFGVVLGLLLIGSLSGYLIYLKRRRSPSEKIISIRSKIKKVNENIHIGNKDLIIELHEQISKEYSNLNSKEKVIVYGDIEKLHQKIGFE